MNKKLFIALVSSVLLNLSFVATAVNIPPAPGQPGGINPVNSVPDFINGVLNFMYPVFFGFAFIMFVVAAFLFLTAEGEPDKITSAKKALIWSVVGLIVGMISLSIPFIVLWLFIGGNP